MIKSVQDFCDLADVVGGKGIYANPWNTYDETFFPITHFEPLQLLLALAALEDWHIHQMDIKSVFLNGMLNEEIYIVVLDWAWQFCTMF